MTLSAIPGKIPEIDQSCSNSIFRVVLQLSPARVSVFEKPLKLRVVHIRKKLKISIFSKMASTILIKFCEFIVHSKSSSITLSAFFGKNA